MLSDARILARRKPAASTMIMHLLATTALAALSALCPASGEALAADSGYDELFGYDELVNGVSADGLFVIGQRKSISGGDAHAFRWSLADGSDDLGSLGGNMSAATGVSADGAVIVGYNGNGPVGSAFIWTETGGMVDLGALPGDTSSKALAVNADGSVVVGSSTAGNVTRAFRWTQGVMTEISTLGGDTIAYAVSADGSVVAGSYGGTGGAPTEHAFRWTLAGNTMTDLGLLSDGRYSVAQGISADGLVVVGYADHTNDPTVANPDYFEHAFRWTAGTGMVDLGVLSGFNFSYASATNRDGSVVVGYLLGGGTQGFRWASATGMRTVEDWLRDNGVTVARDFTADATGVSADGNIVVGNTVDANGNVDGNGYIARVVVPTGNGGNSGGGSGIIDLEQYARTLAGKPTAQIGLDFAGTALNGAHGEPMRNLLDAGKQSFSVTADTGYDNGSFSDGGVGIGDLAYGIGLEGGATARFALGGLYTKQDLDDGGDFKQKGVYFAPEVTLPIGGQIYATVSGYYAPGKLDIDRQYLNGGLPDTSHGETDIDTWAAKLRLDWLNAATVQDTKLTPYASITYAHAQMDGYTEEGGSFPSEFDSTSDHSTVARLGLDTVTDITSTIRLTGKAEAAYRFEKQTANISGTIVGLSDFNLDGADIDQFWVRGAIGAEFDAGGGTASLSINASTEGDDPTVWLKSGWKVTF